MSNVRSLRGDPDQIVTLVDTNVLLDVLNEDAVWFTWSARALAEAADAGVVAINPVIYAETSVSFATVEELDGAVPAADYRREALPYAAGFLAGKAFLRYRRAGGTKSAPLPDFYIGAHAAVCGYQLLTRDAARFRTYFPTVRVLAPG